MRTNTHRVGRLLGSLCLGILMALSLAGVSPAAPRFERLPEGTLYFSMCPPEQEEDVDGRCIAGTDSDGGLLGTGVMENETVEKVPPEIFSWDGTGEPRQITQNQWFEFGTMVWSPDGSRFLISADTHSDAEECRLYVVRVEDGHMRAITPHQELACAMASDWSPDGEWILLSAFFHDGPTQLYKVRPDGSDLTKLTRFDSEGQDAYDGHWIENGKAILFHGSVSEGSRGIYRMTSRGKKRRTLHEFRTSNRSSQFLVDLELSPNRRRITYILTIDGRRVKPRSDLYLTTTEGSRRRLTFNDIHEYGVDWDPEGSQIATFVGDPYAGNKPRIRLIADSGRAETITTTKGRRMDWLHGPVWSPSGNYLAFQVTEARLQAPHGISMVGAAGGKKRILIEVDGAIHLWDWRASQ